MWLVLLLSLLLPMVLADTTTAPPTPTCPPGTKCFGNFAYTFHSANTYWKQASKTCNFRKYGGRSGDLASIPNKEVNEFIHDLVSGIDYFWVGGYLVDRRLLWTDGSAGNYTNWYDGSIQWKYTLSNDQCVYVNTAQYLPKAPGTWGYEPCDKKTFPFVCQYPLA